ncbi:MAG: GAF domain-containing protein [Candidatus Omnitrophota bacterium]|jgi:putative nucleotidyltransferase with HDIG domain
MAAGNILVIDNELEIFQFLDNLLKDEGYIIRHALSGQEGVSKFQEGNFDVIVCNLQLSDTNGIKVLKRIRSLDQDSIVIAFTDRPSFENVKTVLGLGAYGYITKPISAEEVSFIIKRAFDFRNLALTNRRLMQELKEQNIKLEEKVKERTNELALLYIIGRDISSTLKLDEVLETIVDRVSAVLGLEICSILLVDKDSDQLLIRYARGLDNEIISKTKLKIGEEISGWVIKHKQALLVNDIEKDPRFTRRNKEKYYTHSFISAPLVAKGKVIGVINTNNKKSRQPFTEDDLRFVKGVASEAAIAVEHARLYTSLEDTYIRTVMALTSAIDARDHYTRSHSEHVTKYAVAIAEEMNLSEIQIKEIRQACQLHDLGKIGVHDYILNKPAKLNLKEREEVRSHALKSAEILKPLTFLSGVIKLIEQHHEWYDGNGYPFGIKGEEIRLGARIIAVVDSFDAMITERPYRKPFTKEEAIQELIDNSSTQFDPKVVEIFLRVLEKNPGIIKDKG